MNPQILEILKQMIALPLEDQRTLNTMLVDNMKHVDKLEAIKNSVKFNVGDVVMFEAGRKGLIKMQVDGFSRDGSKIKGIQIGGLYAGYLWTISSNTSSLRKIS